MIIDRLDEKWLNFHSINYANRNEQEEKKLHSTQLNSSLINIPFDDLIWSFVFYYAIRRFYQWNQFIKCDIFIFCLLYHRIDIKLSNQTE